MSFLVAAAALSVQLVSLHVFALGCLFFITLPLVGVLVGSACLACWLLGVWENTYSDGWIMDKEKNRIFLCVGCLVCLLLIACAIQWMDGWMDGWMRRCCINKGGRREGARGRR